jgi:hypothetical protein
MAPFKHFWSTNAAWFQNIGCNYDAGMTLKMIMQKLSGEMTQWILYTEIITLNCLNSVSLRPTADEPNLVHISDFALPKEATSF